MTGYCTLHLSGEPLDALRAAVEHAFARASTDLTRDAMGRLLLYVDDKLTQGLERADKVRERNRIAKREQIARERAVAEGRPVIPPKRPGRRPKAEAA